MLPENWNNPTRLRKGFLVLILVGLCACGSDTSSEEYLARAKEYIADANFAAASIELQNALKIDASLAEASWLLAGLYFDVGDIGAAEHEYRRAGELGWSADEVVLALAQVDMARGQFADVLAREVDGLSPRGVADLLSQQAVAALATGQPEKARQLLDSAAGADPQSVEVALARATLHLNVGEYAEASDEVNAVLQRKPKMARAWRLKAQALMRMEKLEAARDALDRSIEFSQFSFLLLVNL